MTTKPSRAIWNGHCWVRYGVRDVHNGRHWVRRRDQLECYDPETCEWEPVEQIYREPDHQ